MKMGPRDTYLCFIPPSTKQEPQPPEESITEVTASHSWSLLQPLDGTCLYVCGLSAFFFRLSDLFLASPRMVHLRILPQLPCPAIPRIDSLASNGPGCASTLCQLPLSLTKFQEKLM